MSMLALQSVSKTFGGVRAVDNVSFGVARGEVVGLMGANGAGKTTLFSLIAGHERPDAGAITLQGRTIVGLRPDGVCRLGIARTFQIVRPFRGLSVLENVLVGVTFGRTRPAGASASRDAAMTCLEVMSLADQAGRPAGELTLSGQKRLEVARALATGPDLLLLDEVMAGLTPGEVRDMMATLLCLRTEQGVTLLVIEHVMHALMELSDRIVVLHHGRKIAEGAPADIADEQAVRDAYLGDGT